MKIVFLGTGHGVPSADRSCSSVMLEIGGAIYFVDAGTAVAERTMKVGRRMEDVRAVFTTHAHGDHINGIYHLAELYNWKFKETAIEIFMTEEKVGEAVKSLIELTNKAVDGDRIKFLTATEGKMYEDENVRVTYYPTKHLSALGRPSYGILIEGEGKRVYFTGDMSQWLEGGDFPTEMAGSGLDLFVTEFAHFRSEHLFPHLAGVNAKAVAFTHVYPLDKYEEIEGLRGKYGFEVLTPSDFEEFEI